MTYDYYEYGDAEVNLSFKFKKCPEIKENKKQFLKLLKQAVADLENEVQK